MAGYDVNRRVNPQQFRRAVQNVRNVALSASEETVARGADWYPKVHDATAQGARGLGITTRQGAGIVAAVSPNMDWEKNNIRALEEIGDVGPTHWSMIEASAQSGRRIPEVRDMLREVAPSISASTDIGLLKARDILHGADYDEILTRRTAPKTNSFAHNIEHPGSNRHVTIDGRAADIIANRMRPWNEARGIKSAAISSGKPTRYEDHEAVYHYAAETLARRAPGFAGLPTSAVQAITWERGKEIEREGLTKTGQPRKQARRRDGSPYLP